MRSATRHLRAQYHYLKRPIIDFMPLLLLMCILLVAGGLAFQKYYHEEKLTFLRALYVTYCLIFMEHVFPFPRHWLLQFFYLALPPLGLVVILDGIVRFSYHILRRDETGKEWVCAMALTMNNHVILCGLGKVGLRVLQQLVRLGEEVIVLERNPQCPNLAYAHKNGIPVRIGSGREDGIFEELNAARAKSIILATNDDLANLEMALDARKARPGIRVVMRMFDQELASKIRESFELDLAFSTSELAAPLFATASSDRSIVNSFYVGDQLLVVAEIAIRDNAKLAGSRIRDLGKRQAFVLSITHASGTDVFPHADLELRAGDRITVQTDPSTLKEIHRLNNDPESW